MTTDQLLARAGELARYADDTSLLNAIEVSVTLQSEFGVSKYRADSAVAKAARLRRHALQTDEIRRLTPATAAKEFGGSSSNIRRACTLGYLNAQQDDFGRWSFTVASLKTWLAAGKHTPGKDSSHA